MKKKFLYLFVIIFSTFIVYLPCLKNSFVWDDGLLLTGNPLIRDFSLNGIIKIFTSIHVNLYHPLVMLTYLFEYKFFKLNPFPYHLTNLILHIFNTIAVFYLIYLIINKKNFTIPFLTSIIFSIHPLRVESVAWIAERKDVLFAFFFLTSFIFYIKFKETKLKKYYWLSITSFFLSLISKPMAVTLPAVLILYDYYKGRKFDINIIVDKILFIILSFIFSMLTIIENILRGNAPQNSFSSIFYNISNSAYGVIFYIYKTFLPLNLSCHYESLKNIDGYILYLAPVIFLLIIFISIYSLKWTKVIFFSVFFFIITLLPALHIIPVSRAIHADRYTYIPHIGIIFLVSYSFEYFYRKFKLFKTILPPIVIFTILSTGILSNRRCYIWKDDITLWSDVLKKNPKNSIAYSNRASSYSTKQDYEKALPDLLKAIELDPYYVDAYINLSNLYCKTSRFKDAENLLDSAIEKINNNSQLYFSRGYARENLGKIEDAISDYTKSIEIDKTNILSYNNRGCLYHNRLEYDKAISDFTRIIELDSQNVKAYYNRANSYFRKKLYENAISDYKTAIKLAPEISRPYIMLANLYVEIKQYRLALENYNMAISIEPSSLYLYDNRARVNILLGDIKLAEKDIIFLKENKYPNLNQIIEILNRNKK